MSDTIQELVVRIRMEFVKGQAPDLSPITKAAQDASRQMAASFQGAANPVGKIETAVRNAAAAMTGSASQQISALRQLIASLDKESEARKKLQADLTASIALREREAAAQRQQAREAQISAAFADDQAKRTRSIFTSERLAAYNRGKAQEDKNEVAGDRFSEIRTAERLAAFKRQKLEEQSALQKRLQEEAAQGVQAAQQATIRAETSMRGLGEATMLVVRGFVMLGASGQKDVEKVMHALLQIQGMIDLYKGLTGIVVDLGNAHRALAAASAASAAAQAASAAAGRAGAASGAAGSALGTAAATGGLAGLARFGPHGAVIAAGLGIGYGINKYFDLSGQEAITKKQNEAWMRREGTRDDDNAGLGQWAMRRTLRDQAQNQRIHMRIASGGLHAGGSGALALYQHQASDASRFVEQASDKNNAGDYSANLNAQKAARELQITAEKNLLEVLKQQVDLRQRQLDKQREAVQAAKDALQSEKDRNASIYTTLGGLNPGEQARLKQLNKKAGEGGDLTEQELKYIESKLGSAAQDFVDVRREKKGRKAFGNGEGIGNLVDRTGPLEGEGSEQQRRQREVVRQIEGGGTGQSVSKLIDALTEARKKEAAQIDKVTAAIKGLDVVAVAIERLAKASEATQRRLARLEQINRAG